MPVYNKSQIAALIAANLPDNVTNDITPEDLREVLNAISDSFFNLTSDKALSGLSDWDSSKSYSLGKAVIYNNVIYKAISAPTSTGSFNGSEWQQISSYNEQSGDFDDYLLINKSIELDDNKQVKALADGANLSNIDTGFYLVYTSTSTGLNLDYPAAGKGFLTIFKSGLDTLQIFYPLNDITQYYTRKIGENWNFIDLQATADYTFSGGISEDEGEVKLGGAFDTVTLSGNDLTLNTPVNFTGSVTSVKNINLTEEQTGVDDLTLITKSYVDNYLGSFASTSFVENAVEGFATETYVQLAIADIVDSAPSTLDTLNELSAALGNDENFATTVTNQIADKASTSWVKDNYLSLTGGTMNLGGTELTISGTNGNGYKDVVFDVENEEPNDSFRLNLGANNSMDGTLTQVVVGKSSTVTDYGFAFGGWNKTGMACVNFGFNHDSSNTQFNSAFGNNVRFTNSDYSFGLGANINFQNVQNSFAIGTGVSNTSFLNTPAWSINLGVYTNKAPFHLKRGNPDTGSGGWGQIAIGGHTDATARLDLKAGNASLTPFRIRKNTTDRSVTNLKAGEFQFKSTGRLGFSPDDATEEEFAYLSDVDITTVNGLSGSNGEVKLGGNLSEDTDLSGAINLTVNTTTNVQTAESGPAFSKLEMFPATTYLTAFDGSNTAKLTVTSAASKLETNSNFLEITNTMISLYGNNLGTLTFTSTETSLSSYDNASLELYSSDNLNFNIYGDSTFRDYSTAGHGLKYYTDYSSSFTDRSLVDKAYVDNTAPRKLFVNSTYKGTANQVDTDLHTYTLKANTFNDSNIIVLSYKGYYSQSTTDVKRVKFYVGAELLFTSPDISTAGIDGLWSFDITIKKSGTWTYVHYTYKDNLGNDILFKINFSTVDFTIDQDIRIVGYSGDGSVTGLDLSKGVIY